MNMVVTPPPLPVEPKPVVFSGDRGVFRRLVTRGAALELVTAGFYRFWLATDMRRHLWSQTQVDSDAAEYTGRARELLIGFLIAMAILAPMYVAYFLLGIEAERWQAFASTPVFLFFYAFGQFAIYRARRYRLTRTWDDRRLLPISMLYASQIHVGLKRRKTHSAQTTRPP